ncbi:SLC13 family permease [Saccharibacillus sp. JS10]|uniref:SLC13 family permease n=1 Tax=Saccharibacillus sp. JS10 TaxID=2950552 RepID=UPI00210B295A|nr:SLC13 family permease [Saccharibacillus sp. JS10]MCQ4086295.1 SLC13 family permease [Saccharibacillus sp. JS10]
MISDMEPAFWPIYTAIAVFVIAYLLVVTEKVNAGVAALTGGLLLLILGIVDWNAAFSQHIGWHTLWLITNMMIIAASIDRSGIVHFAAIRIVQLFSSNGFIILGFMTLVAAVAAALLGSGPALLLLAPLILRIGKLLNIRPVPFLIMSVIACNLGGMTTLVGSVPNMMIGAAADLDTRAFASYLLLPVVFLLLVHMAILLLIFRRELRTSATEKQERAKLDPYAYLAGRRQAVWSLIVLVVLIIGLIWHKQLDMTSSAVASIAALAMIVVNVHSMEDVRKIRERMDFKTLGVIAGFYVIAAGLVETGITGEMAARLLELTNENKSLTALVLFAIVGIFSAVLDPIPLIAGVIPLIETIGFQMEVVRPKDLQSLWLAVALGSGIGSSGTLAGSVAGVLAAGFAYKEGYRFSYLSYLLIALPLTLLALVLGGWYLYTYIL